MPIKIVAEPEGEHTRLTIEQSTWPRALGFGIGTGVNLIIGLIMATLAVAQAGPFWIPALVLLLFSATFGSISYLASKSWSQKSIKEFKEALRDVKYLAGSDQPAPPVAETGSRKSQIDLDDIDPSDQTEPNAAARRQREQR